MRPGGGPSDGEAPGSGAFRLGAPRATGEGVEVAVAVPADCPWFEGHFPGEPLLPGVAHLQIATLVAGLAGGGEPAALTAVETMRWSDPVGPGEELVAVLAPAGEGRSRFQLRRADGVHGGGKGVSAGTLAWAPARGDLREGGRQGGTAATDERPAGEEAVPVADPRPLAGLLPHRPPARLAEELLAADAERLVCRGRIGAGHPAVSPLGAPSFLAVELAAQACAGWSLAGDGAGAALRIGYLVRLRDVRLSRPWLDPDAPLTADVEIEARTGPLTLCRFRITGKAAAEIATGQLGVFQPPTD